MKISIHRVNKDETFVLENEEEEKNQKQIVDLKNRLDVLEYFSNIFLFPHSMPTVVFFSKDVDYKN